MNTPADSLILVRTTELVSAYYSQLIDRLWRDRGFGSDELPLIHVEMDFDQLNRWLPDDDERLAPLLADWIETTAKVRSGVLVLPNITLHAALERLQLARKLPGLVDPLKCAIAQLQTRKCRQILMAGTRHTMTSDLLSGVFSAAGIRVDFPQKEDISALDKLRLVVMYDGYQPVLQETMNRILQKYDNVVLACSELSLLNAGSQMTAPSGMTDPYLDLCILQVQEAISMLLSSGNRVFLSSHFQSINLLFEFLFR